MEMKSCPFCGSTDIRNKDNGMGQNLTGCDKCGARVYYKFNSLEDAEIAWNTRPIEDALQKMIDELEKENAELKKHQIPEGWICHP